MTPEEIRSRLDSNVRRINALKNPGARAKQTMIARAYIEAREALSQLREQEIEQIGRERTRLDRKLFGTNGFSPDPNAVIARRDANDRAAKLETPAEAAHALRRAEREGDHIMAKAIAAKAADYSGDPVWAQVVHQYVADKPDEAAILQAMQDLPDTDDGVWQITKAIEYSAPKPSELGEQLPEGLAALPLDGDAPTAA
ncbi:hypothetical protein OHS33_11720 [Streptomyces sp. NBC_00536]|uniref:hypothetical protein n=1 Tax=Streptomyces sp. NBC_00536 TaxID=2975769 RepID=UPI002E805366|nr:hypothetical protein [Streptomyces sp. NBC_00536]WUC78945.1 hypothetical protein OHS33_11720 [Streptomyces sp. NBC_00536]